MLLTGKWATALSLTYENKFKNSEKLAKSYNLFMISGLFCNKFGIIPLT